MKATFIVSIGTLLASVSSQSFESPDFDAAEALFSKGVDVTLIPQLSNLTGHYGNNSCSLAVSLIRNPPRVSFSHS